MEKHFQPSEPVKAEAIDFFIREYGDKISLITTELRFGSLSSSADIAIIVNNKLIAIEVKSKSDKLSLLSTQLSNYKLVFDEVYLILEKKGNKHFSPESLNINGLMILENNKIELLTNKKFKNPSRSKTEILYSIPITFLKTKIPSLANLNASSVRSHIIEKYNLDQCQTLMLEYLLKSRSKNYELFTKERGVITHLEDIQLFKSRILK